MQAMLGIVCALKCEAEALIRYFSLKSYPQKTAFPIYCCKNIFLIVSGVGKTQAAAATAYLYVLTGCSEWLNVGVGGHRTQEIGLGMLAHKILDEESGRAYYPTFGWRLKESTASIITVDKVEREYVKEGVYDMEAAGFCSAAFRFASAEVIHCYKIISDNQKKLPTCNRDLICSLVENRLGEIEALIQKYDLSDPKEFLAAFLARWHFSSTQQHKLSRLLQKWGACFPEKSVWDIIERCRNGKEVIRVLDQCFS